MIHNVFLTLAPASEDRHHHIFCSLLYITGEWGGAVLLFLSSIGLPLGGSFDFQFILFSPPDSTSFGYSRTALYNPQKNTTEQSFYPSVDSDDALWSQLRERRVLIERFGGAR